MNEEVRTLGVILKSRFPLVVIETPEEPRVIRLLEQACNLENLPLFLWSAVDGIKRMNRADAVAQTANFSDAIRHVDKTNQNGVYALLDAHPYLEDPVHLRYVREIAMDYHRNERTLVFVSPRIALPAEIARMCATFRPSLPTIADIRALFKEELDLWATRRQGERARGSREAAELMIQQLVGMYIDDARRLIRQCLEDDGAITMKDVARVLRQKHESLASGGVLHLETATDNFGNVGGQGQLKRWLELRRAVFLGMPGGEGLDQPKGVLLLGVQGGGKSLAAKALAGTWGVPLLRLDFGALYNKFHGETERNLRTALETAGAMEPCVLWLDEVEKGIASGDGGVSRRVLATLLTWMSERTKRVFLVATANDIANLPPEVLRKGRFDEIFFVDLPDETTRAKIFRIHLQKRNCKPEDFDLAALAANTAGFSGAEIEQAIVASLYEARHERVALTTAHTLAEVRRTRPLSRIRTVRAWAGERTVMAN